jgi:predicted permease
MRRARRVLAKVRALVQGDRLDEDLRAELESHLALHVEDNLRAGMTPEDARRDARLTLGGLAQVEEQYRSARGVPWLEHLARDARYGARSLAAAPGFTLVAIATLGLGIGANAAIFSVINAAFFRPLPVERPDELVSINSVRAGAPTFSYPDYRDFRDRSSLLSEIAAMRLSAMNLETHDRATRIWGYLVTGNYFDLLGVTAALGRTMTRADDRLPGAHPVLVLAHDFWQSRFAADPDVVGRTVRINGSAFTILGVMPAGFRGTERLLAPDVWVPIMMQAHIEQGNAWLERRQTENVLLLGRRRNKVSNAEAEASLNAIAAQLAREHPATHEGMRVVLTPPGLVGSLLRGPVLGFSNALLGLSGLVLLLACTNLTGLLLARSTDRQRDTSVRLALGASRSDLIRRTLVESALLSAGGAAAALLLAYWAAAALSGWRLPVDIPLTATIAIDHRVLIFSLGLAVASTLLVGILPAIQGTKTDVMLTLKEDTVRWRGGWHLRDAVVGLQVALSTLLLIGALLVIGSLRHAMTVDVGFNPRGAVSARMELGLHGYDLARGREFQRRVVEDVGTLPGIESVAVANALPLSTDISTHTVFVEGQPEPRGRDVPEAIYYQVSPGFFHTMGTRVVSGREFTPRDTTTRIAVVNQAFATQLLGSGDPVGKRFRSGRSGNWIEVVGVVQDGKYRMLGEAATPVAFHPILQWYNPTTTVVARSPLPEGEALELIRTAVRRIDPALALFEEGALSDLLALPLMPVRIAAICLGLFGGLAVALVLVGVYGAISYGIAQRTREICIRLAVGASSSHIVRLVLGRAAAIWVVGAAAGTAAAVAVAPLLTPILVGGESRDPAVIGFACGILALVTAAACWLPTRRALVADPSALLRRN